MKPVLHIDQLSIGYKNHLIAQDLNLRVKKGELVCLIGPNGAGKSTLLKSIVNLLKPIKGKILHEGNSLHKLSARDLARKIGIVLTDRVDSNLNVYTLVSMGRYPYTHWSGKMKERDVEMIRWAIEVTGLGALADRPVYQLSDGERQKAMIARVLAQDTPIIVLDEPTAHLDIPNRLELLGLLRKLSREEQKAIILSIHDLESALQLADKVWLMDGDGRVEAGVPEDLVLQSCIQQVFERESLHFDFKMGSFRLVQNQGALVSIQGPDPALTWTSRALIRQGYQVRNVKMDGLMHISLSEHESRYTWHIKSDQEEQSVDSIAALLEFLKKQ